MQLKFKPNFKNSKTQIITIVAATWQKAHRYVFFVCLLSAFIFGWYIWRKSLSENFWSETKKQEYLDSQSKGVVFNQKNFEKVLADIELRKQKSANYNYEWKDTFKLD